MPASLFQLFSTRRLSPFSQSGTHLCDDPPFTGLFSEVFSSPKATEKSVFESFPVGIELDIGWRFLEKKVISVSNHRAWIVFPNGERIEGTYTGRYLALRIGNIFSRILFLSQTSVCGNGKFESLEVTHQGKSGKISYKGEFRGNLFDTTFLSQATYATNNIRFLGSFLEGKRSGGGRLERYDAEMGEFRVEFDGTWNEDKPYDGYGFTTAGEKIIYREGVPAYQKSQEEPVSIIPAIAHPAQQIFFSVSNESPPCFMPDDDDFGDERAQERKRKERLSRWQNTFQVFGADVWKTYLDADIGEEPPLPSNIKEILESPCPIWPDQTIGETHLLVLVPKMVNNRPFSIDVLEELVQHPINGGKAIQINRKQSYRVVLERLGPKPAPDSHWALVAKQVVPGSYNKFKTEQDKVLEELNQRTGASYEKAPLLDVLTGALLNYVRTGKRVFDARTDDNAYLDGVVQDCFATRCIEYKNEKGRIVRRDLLLRKIFVNFSSENGPSINEYSMTPIIGSVGILVSRNLS